VPREEWLAKIRAAAAARRDHDIVIIARTDARAVAGFEEAVARANAAFAAGADMAFVEAPQTIDEVAAVPRLVDGPYLFNLVYRGKSPPVDLGEIDRMGYKLTIVPAVLMMGIVDVCERQLAELKTARRHPAPVAEMSLRDMFRRFGADEWEARRTGFGAAPAARGGSD
jgi:2-methylisocitrate lyase-like PEP mutase family enzyme